jgi:hypothetical protein
MIIERHVERVPEFLNRSEGTEKVLAGNNISGLDI